MLGTRQRAARHVLEQQLGIHHEAELRIGQGFGAAQPLVAMRIEHPLVFLQQIDDPARIDGGRVLRAPP